MAMLFPSQNASKLRRYLPMAINSHRYFRTVLNTDRYSFDPTLSIYTEGAFNVVKRASPLILDSVETILDGKSQRNDHSNVTIADIGCSVGSNTINVMSDACSLIREFDDNRATNPDFTQTTPISILYNDQFGNDFNALFANIGGYNRDLHRRTKKDYFWRQFRNIYPMATANNFYGHISPPDSINIAFSISAMHILSRLPTNIVGALHSVISEPEERQKFAKQFAQDWNRNLLNRATELRKGGRLIVVNQCLDDQSHTPSQQYTGYAPFESSNKGILMSDMHENFREIWFGMVNDHLITTEEFIHTNFLEYYPTIDEMIAPLEDVESEVYQSGLRLVSAEIANTECPFHKRWMKETAADKTIDGESAAEYSVEFTPMVRTFSDEVLFGGLDAKRTVAQRVEIVDEFFERYRRKVADLPNEHSLDYVHAMLVFEKV